MSFVVAQVSDPHLGGAGRPFQSNYETVVAGMGAIAPYLIIVSGDVSFDGAGSDADMAYAAAQLGRLGTVHAIPGNHDVGDAHAAQQPVTDERLRRWRDAFGPDCWVLEHEGWLILGLNSQVLGAHPDEGAQAALITEALATLGDRLLALFVHKPFWVPDGAAKYWPSPAAGMAAVLHHPALRLIASGHLHLRRSSVEGRVATEWAPAVSFVVRAEEQVALPGERVCGVLLHRFDAEAVETTMWCPPGMTTPYLHDFGSLYPAAT